MFKQQWNSRPWCKVWIFVGKHLNCIWKVDWQKKKLCTVAYLNEYIIVASCLLRTCVFIHIFYFSTLCKLFRSFGGNAGSYLYGCRSIWTSYFLCLFFALRNITPHIKCTAFANDTSNRKYKCGTHAIHQIVEWNKPKKRRRQNNNNNKKHMQHALYQMHLRIFPFEQQKLFPIAFHTAHQLNNACCIIFSDRLNLEMSRQTIISALARAQIAPFHSTLLSTDGMNVAICQELLRVFHLYFDRKVCFSLQIVWFYLRIVFSTHWIDWTFGTFELWKPNVNPNTIIVICNQFLMTIQSIE